MTTYLCVWVLVPALFVQTAAAELIHTLVSPNEETEGHFGWSVDGGVHVNLGPYPDIIVGAPHEDVSFINDGRVYVYGGGTGAVILTLTSPNADDYGNFGAAVCGISDVNNDGADDIIVGARTEDPGPSPEACGRAYVFSGLTGTVIHTMASPDEEASGAFGWSVSTAGDANNDGTADIVVGAPSEDPGPSPSGAGRAYIFNGANGALMHTLISPNEEVNGFFGESVSGAGDVNQDGFDDVVVGASAEDPGGKAYVFSGETGAAIHTLISPNEELGGGFGFAVSGVGDVNGDGYDDVLVGAPAEGPNTSPDGAGRAYVFSGVNGQVLHTLVSPYEETGGSFGCSVGSIGDVDGDEVEELAVGAQYEDPGPMIPGAGMAYAFSGATGERLCVVVSANTSYNGRFGCSVSRAGDVTFSGRGTLVVGAYTESPTASPDEAGRAYVFDPALILTGSVSGGTLVLEWTPCFGAGAYWVYAAEDEAYFQPGFAPGYEYRVDVLPPTTTTWSSSAGIGDPVHSWTYRVLGMDALFEIEMAGSNRFGETDYLLDIP